MQRLHVRELGEQPTGTTRAAQPGNDGLPPAGAFYAHAPSNGRQEAAAREAGVNMIVVWLLVCGRWLGTEGEEVRNR